jgi:hypothetical protein
MDEAEIPKAGFLTTKGTKKAQRARRISGIHKEDRVPRK